MPLQLYQEQQSSSFGKEDVQDSGEGEDELEDIPDTIFESEVLKNKGSSSHELLLEPRTRVKGGVRFVWLFVLVSTELSGWRGCRREAL